MTKRETFYYCIITSNNESNLRIAANFLHWFATHNENMPFEHFEERDPETTRLLFIKIKSKSFRMVEILGESIYQILPNIKGTEFHHVQAQIPV